MRFYFERDTMVKFYGSLVNDLLMCFTYISLADALVFGDLKAMQYSLRI